MDLHVKTNSIAPKKEEIPFETSRTFYGVKFTSFHNIPFNGFSSFDNRFLSPPSVVIAPKESTSPSDTASGVSVTATATPFSLATEPEKEHD